MSRRIELLSGRGTFPSTLRWCGGLQGLREGLYGFVFLNAGGGREAGRGTRGRRDEEWVGVRGSWGALIKMPSPCTGTNPWAWQAVALRARAGVQELNPKAERA